ncbi:hypothetical protein L6452_22405 [Arctium lappa]|uniref:Uncharacterized protein n=1 Tax=Arctium lappa TaxID=4217 RepID=A0ACB9B025_ARCLA|nr:hypothetical protein L6452_22405 [Arctium lappa]
MTAKYILKIDDVVDEMIEVLVESLITERKMEVIEDDLFYADLSKRISLLIMDDDEDPTVVYCPPVSLQVISQTIHPIHNQIPSLHDQNGRREIKGTGVFIPRSSTNPRRSKHSRSKSSSNTTRTQTQRHVDTNSSGHFPHEPYHNHNSTNPNSYNSLNHKRCY